MIRRRPTKINGFIILTLFAILLPIQPSVAFGQSQAILSAVNTRQDNAKPDSQGSVSDPGGGKSAEMIVAELSDEQVRRLLIEELRKQTKPAQPVEEEQAGALVRFIRKIRFLTDVIHWRIYELRSDTGTDPEAIPHFFHLLSKDEGG